MPKHSISIKGIPVAYSDSGKGIAVVCLHGFLETKSMWNPLLALPKKYRIISIDLLGHGDTPCLGYVHSMELMAEIVFKVLSGLRLRSYFVIGHSMGGYVALEMLYNKPSSIKGLLMLNSTPLDDSDEKKIERDRAILAVKSSRTHFLGNAIENLFAPYNISLYQDQIQEILLNAKKTSIQGIVAALEGMKIRKNHLETLKNCHNTRVILGEKDPVLNYESLQGIFKKNNIDFDTIPDGHMSIVEQPVLTVEMISKFLKRLPALSR
ncbi:MAG: alpha/beta hydrolase [Flavobacteriaceae bacterium]|nr:alpha/beta hydrolase [Flavobacteriaceae bacterium]MDG2314363.1 alpha/beta hydrolase [Flavobacteriaceae bacterium]